MFWRPPWTGRVPALLGDTAGLREGRGACGAGGCGGAQKGGQEGSGRGELGPCCFYQLRYLSLVLNEERLLSPIRWGLSSLGRAALGLAFTQSLRMLFIA